MSLLADVETFTQTVGTIVSQLASRNTNTVPHSAKITRGNVLSEMPITTVVQSFKKRLFGATVTARGAKKPISPVSTRYQLSFDAESARFSFKLFLLRYPVRIVLARPGDANEVLSVDLLSPTHHSGRALGSRAKCY